MNKYRHLTRKQILFGLIILLGFLLKYNYLLLRVFYVPSILGLALKNLVIISFYLYFLFPIVKTKKGRNILFVLSLFFTLIFFSNLWYNRYFGNHLSLNDMMMGQGLRPVKVLLRQIIFLSDFIYIIDTIVIVYLFISIKNVDTNKNPYSFNESSKQKTSTKIIISLLIVSLLITQIIVTNFSLDNKKPATMYNQSTPGFVNTYGLFPLYFYELYISLFKKNIAEFDSSILDEFETDFDEKGIIKNDLNIIAIQIESLDAKIIDYKHNGKEISPFLNKLKDESIYFDNVYAQHINGSFDAEVSFLTSLYPINSNYTFKVNDMTKFNSLVGVFNDNGYETLAFHGNDEKFFFRHKGYPELGFDRFYSRKDFSASEGVMESDSYLGINDYDFFKQSVDYLEKTTKPFFGFFITVTSHTPFDFYPSNSMVDEFSDISNPLVRDYFQSISFVDSSIEMFFNELKEKDLYDDTLFIIYSDHVSGIEKPEYSCGSNFLMEKKVKEPEHIPLLIHYPGTEANTINKTGTTTDFAPTLLDILDAKKIPEDFIGSSLLKGKEKPVLFLHEYPQILYKDYLFEKQQLESENDFVKIGYKPYVEISKDDKEKIIKTIESMKEIMTYKQTGLSD